MYAFASVSSGSFGGYQAHLRTGCNAGETTSANMNGSTLSS